MLTTVLFVAAGVLAGLLAGLKIVAPLTVNSTDDKVLSVLEKIPLEKILQYVATRKV